MSAWRADELGHMRAAIALAREAGDAGEIPVGAVIVQGGCVIGEGGNRTIRDRDPSGHAEIVALRRAGATCGNHRLTAAELYVTLEPCAMCMGAVLEARLQRVVFGAYDDRSGACGSVLDLSAEPNLNRRVEVTGGLLAEESAALLRAFFAARRAPG